MSTTCSTKSTDVNASFESDPQQSTLPQTARVMASLAEKTVTELGESQPKFPSSLREFSEIFRKILEETWNIYFQLNLHFQVELRTVSSTHVLYFLQHAAYFWSTWMTSCVHLKDKGLVISDCYLSGRMETISMWEEGNKRKKCFEYTHDIIKVDQKYAACCEK